MNTNMQKRYQGRRVKSDGDTGDNPAIKNAEMLLEQVKDQAESVFAQYETQVSEQGKATEEVRSQFKEQMETVAELTEKVEAMSAKALDMQQKMSAFGQEQPITESMGTKFVESEQFKAMQSGEKKEAFASVKNTILGETSGDPDGVLSQAQRMQGIVPKASRSLNLLDFIPIGQTNTNAIEYVQQNTDTNSAAETAEGAQKPESAITFQLVTEFVRTVATWLKISEQALSDSPYVEAFINARLSYFVRKRLQSQIVAGDGSGANLSGFLNTGRFTAFSGTSGAHELDSINEMRVQVEAADYEPDTVLLNPVDFGRIERLKDTADGYLGGNGGAVYYPAQGAPTQFWGLNAVKSNDIPVGNAAVMDSNAIQLIMRDDIGIKFFDQDEDNAQKNLVTIRAELRAALAVYDVPAIVYGDLTPA